MNPIKTSRLVTTFTKSVGLAVFIIAIPVASSHAGVAANSYLGSWSAELSGTPSYNTSTNLTRFSYTLYGQTFVAGDPRTGKDLSHWVIPLEDGMVVQNASVDMISNPAWSVGFDPTTGVYGLKYDDGQPLNTLYTYSFTLVGQWGIANGRFYIKAGSNRVSESVEEGAVQTPTATVIHNHYSISGMTYIDINGNGQYDINEPPLANVPVALNGKFAVFSDGDGSYRISGLTAGYYSLSVDQTGGGFVDNLNRYFSPTGLSHYSVNLTSDYSNTGFGYRMNVRSILADLDPADTDGNGVTLAGEGRTIGFWKHQLDTLISGKGKAQLDQNQVDALIKHVNNFFLAQPFSITSYSAGSGVMSYKGSDANSLMLKQLLATEFNIFHGMGLSDTTLMSAILMTAEGYANSYTLFSRDQLLEMKNLLDGINNMGH